MAAITWANLTARVPALSAVDVGVQADILDYVNTFVNVAKFGGEDSAKTKLVRIYLALHFGQSELDGAVGNSVTEERYAATEIQVRYADRMNDDNLTETAFGRKYLSLIRASAARVGIVPR